MSRLWIRSRGVIVRESNASGDGSVAESEGLVQSRCNQWTRGEIKGVNLMAYMMPLTRLPELSASLDIIIQTASRLLSNT